MYIVKVSAAKSTLVIPNAKKLLNVHRHPIQQVISRIPMQKQCQRGVDRDPGLITARFYSSGFKPHGLLPISSQSGLADSFSITPFLA